MKTTFEIRHYECDNDDLNVDQIRTRSILRARDIVNVDHAKTIARVFANNNNALFLTTRDDDDNAYLHCNDLNDDDETLIVIFKIENNNVVSIVERDACEYREG